MPARLDKMSTGASHLIAVQYGLIDTPPFAAPRHPVLGRGYCHRGVFCNEPLVLFGVVVSHESLQLAWTNVYAARAGNAQPVADCRDLCASHVLSNFLV